MRIVAINHLTLDGVMQGPGDAGEDLRGGFVHGGWAAPRNNQAMLEAIGRRMPKSGGGMLLGRISYESMLSGWNAKGGPYKDALNNIRKYVVSHDSTTNLPWPNSILVHGDIPAAVADIKSKSDENLVIMGSGELIRSLIPHRLIDEYLLMIHPIVLGSGHRLFERGIPPTDFTSVTSTATPTGVILCSFESPRS
jgi:dihydrofolate reductase